MKYYEQQARMLDDPSKKAVNMARELSLRLGISIATCKCYIYAKRTGYDSVKAYREFLAKVNGLDSAADLARFRRTQKERGGDYTLEQFRANKRRAVNERKLTEYLREHSIPLIYLNCEPSKTEKQIRALDNPNITIAASARNTSKQTGWSYVACFQYISSMRKGITGNINIDCMVRKRGFIDYHEYEMYQDRKSENLELTVEEFRTEKAKKRGFSSIDAYVKFLEDRRLFFQRKESRKTLDCQKEFEYKDIESHDKRGLSTLTPVENGFPLDFNDKAAFWQFIEDTLTPQQCQVICETTVDRKSFRKIGKGLNLTGSRIAQIQAKALRILRHPYRLKMLQEFLR